jgi:DNA-binding NtrC family response regulator
MVLVVDVEVANFIANSPLSKEILKTSLLSKNLNVNTLIYGEIGVGKKTLASIISNTDALFIDNTSLSSISEGNTYIIKDLSLVDLTLLNQTIQDKNIRIVAVLNSNGLLTNRFIDEIFSIKINIPPLINREEDIVPLAQRFLKELNDTFCVDYNFDCNLDFLKTKLSKNAISLKEYIYSNYLLNNVVDDEFIMSTLEDYFLNKINKKSLNDYRDFLYIYDKPMFKAQFKKYKSQVQVAKHLGLNRNTLRRKLAELKI